MKPRRSARTRSRGQALVETSLVLAMLLLLLSGAYAVSAYANDQNTAVAAVRSGARYAAELGNMGWQPGKSVSPTSADESVVSEVCNIANAMPDVVQTTDFTITVYRPQANANGSLASTDLQDVYTVVPSTCAIAGSPAPQYLNTSTTGCVELNDTGGYTMDCRIQQHPNEAHLGVKLTYGYKAPTPLFPLTLSASAYAVTALSPEFS
jgi:Flp pilus assembly protein TadG